MQYPIFPMQNVSISQRAFTTGSHKNLSAIDINGKDTGIENLIAPCRVKVLAVLTKSKTGFNNTVLYGTCDENGAKAAVKCADGTSRILTFAFTHDNYISDIKVGRIFNQLEVCYQEGTTGQATGNHGHIEIGLGWQYTKYKDSYGNWCLKNLVNADKVFWLLKDYSNIVNRGLNGYTLPWTETGSEVSLVEVKEEDDTMRLKCVKGSLTNNRYPTRVSQTANYNKTNYFINVGDIVVIDEMKVSGKDVVCRIADCITNGKSSKVLNKRWFVYDSGYFK